LAAEREFFAVLNRFLPERLRLKRDLAQARDGGADGSVGGVVIEVKRQEVLRLSDWLAQAQQAQAQQSQPCYPVVAFRQNRQDWRCIVEMTPVELAAFMRYTQNIGDTVASIQFNELAERGIAKL
jgi:hypothetical protein